MELHAILFKQPHPRLKTFIFSLRMCQPFFFSRKTSPIFLLAIFCSPFFSLCLFYFSPLFLLCSLSLSSYARHFLPFVCGSVVAKSQPRLGADFCGPQIHSERRRVVKIGLPGIFLFARLYGRKDIQKESFVEPECLNNSECKLISACMCVLTTTQSLSPFSRSQWKDKRF